MMPNVGTLARAVPRFLEKIEAGGPGCWVWKAGRTEDGYGQFSVAGREELAHRVAWQVFRGAIPSGLCVLHSCDNPPCVRPGHLWLGTKTENAADRDRKNRQAAGDRHGTRLHPERMARGDQHPARLHPERLARGEHHGCSKLTENDVLKIRALHSSGVSYRRIAAQFGVDHSNIACIVRRQTWAHLPVGAVEMLRARGMA